MYKAETPMNNACIREPSYNDILNEKLSLASKIAESIKIKTREMTGYEQPVCNDTCKAVCPNNIIEGYISRLSNIIDDLNDIESYISRFI